MTGTRILISSTPSLHKRNHLPLYHFLDAVLPSSRLSKVQISGCVHQQCYRQHLLYELSKDIPQTGVGAFPHKKAFRLKGLSRSFGPLFTYIERY